MCSTLAHRPELEQRAGAGCGGGSQGRGLSQGLGALLLKAKVQVSRTQPHPAGAKAAGAGGGRVTGEGPPGRQAAGPSLPLPGFRPLHMLLPVSAKWAPERPH